MRSGIIAFVLGVVVLQTMPELPSPTILLPGAGMAFAAIFLSRNVLPWLRLAIRCAATCLLGIAWASAFASLYLSHELPKEWEGRDITIVGTVDSLPGATPQGLRFKATLNNPSIFGSRVQDARS